MQGIDSSGGKGWPVAWETGIHDGGAQKTRSTHSPWLGDAYPMGFSLCSSHMANTAHKQIMLKLANCTESWSRRNLAVLDKMEIPTATAKGCEEGGD